MTEKKEPAKKKEDKKKEPKLVVDLSQLFARPTVEEPDEIEWNNMLVKFKFRKVSWPRYNQIVMEALDETSDKPDLYERNKQERIIKEMITEIAGTRMEGEGPWLQLDSAFCETLRKAMFDGTGEMRVSGAMLKNLIPNLEEQIGSTENIKRGRRI